jgi:hypothetical protein
MDFIPENCTDIDEFLEGYIKANGLDHEPLWQQRDMIKTLLMSGLLAGVAILSNRIANTGQQRDASEQIMNIGEQLAKLSTEGLIKLEKLTNEQVGTA